MVLYEIFFRDCHLRDRVLAGMDAYGRSLFGCAVASAICHVVFNALFSLEAEDLFKEGERVYVVFNEEVDPDKVEALLNEKIREITTRERNVDLFLISY